MNYTNVLDYELSKGWVFPFNEVSRDSKILLYGAGKVGQTYYEQMMLAGYNKPVYWVDKNYRYFCDDKVKISSPFGIDIGNVDYAVIAMSDRRTVAQVYDFLLAHGFSEDRIIWQNKSNFFLRSNNFWQRIKKPVLRQAEDVLKTGGSIGNYSISDLESLIDSDNKLILPRLVIMVSTRCNLNCHHCNNLMPYYHNKSYHLNFEEIVTNLRTVIDAIDLCVSLELIGGEPFLYPYLEELLREVLTIPKILNFEVTTNASIIPSEKLINLLSNKKICVNVTHYPQIKNYYKFVSCLHDRGIRINTGEFDWIDSGIPVSHELSESKLKQIYAKCGAGYFCKTLLNGKLYSCARGANLHDLGLCSTGHGQLELYADNAITLKKDIRDFWLDDYNLACDYCTFTDEWRKIPVGT